MALKMPTGGSRAENETIIRWDEEDKIVTIWSASAKVVRRMVKLGVQPSDISPRTNGDIHGYTFHMPLSQFRFTKKRKASPPNPVFKPFPRRVDSCSEDGTPSVRPRTRTEG